MGRYLVWALGLVVWTVLSAAPAAAQVEVGVWTPNAGGRVVLGAPRVYYPAPVYGYPQPRVYVPRDYYYPLYPGYYPPYPGPRGFAIGHFRRHARFARPYYGYPVYPVRPYGVGGYGGPYYRSDRYYRGGDRYRRR